MTLFHKARSFIKLTTIFSNFLLGKFFETSFPFRFTCHGLATGQSYIFRVRAVNAAGLSEYSQDSEAIEVKAAIGKFLIHNFAKEKNDFF